MQTGQLMGSNDAIALTGIAVTLVVSVAKLVYSLRTNKRTMFVNTVTGSRLKWIDSLRDEVSEFIAVTGRLSDRSTPLDRCGELLLRRDTLLHQIALHLNPLDSEDQKINMIANRAKELADGGGADKELAATLLQLREAAASYLKKEWSRVKRESNGEQS
jgi:hypothetical protein